jgi:hypothetical protein
MESNENVLTSLLYIRLSIEYDKYIAFKIQYANHPLLLDFPWHEYFFIEPQDIISTAENIYIEIQKYIGFHAQINSILITELNMQEEKTAKIKRLKHAKESSAHVIVLDSSNSPRARIKKRQRVNDSRSNSASPRSYASTSCSAGNTPRKDGVFFSKKHSSSSSISSNEINPYEYLLQNVNNYKYLYASNPEQRDEFGYLNGEIPEKSYRWIVTPKGDVYLLDLNNLIGRGQAEIYPAYKFGEHYTKYKVKITDCTDFTKISYVSNENAILRQRNLLRDQLFIDKMGLSLTDYYEGDTLTKILYSVENNDQLSKNLMPTNIKLRIIISLLQEVHKIHIDKILHRDLKLDNIIVRPDFTVKIIDYAEAIKFEDLLNNKTKPYTFGYIHPNVFHKPKIPYSILTDLWSVAIICLEIISTFSFNQYLASVINKKAIKTNTIGSKFQTIKQLKKGDIQKIFSDVCNEYPLERPPLIEALRNEIIWFFKNVCEGENIDLLAFSWRLENLPQPLTQAMLHSSSNRSIFNSYATTTTTTYSKLHL